jgi:large subunit ribosomal protein L13
MSSVTAKCFQAKTGEIERHWFSVSAAEEPVGRLATRIATVLMGKHKPTYTPHVDTGDFVVVTDAEKLKFTGRKVEIMEHDYYTYYTSGRKVIPYKTMVEKRPERVIELAVRRMLPKSALGRRLLTKLKVYRGSAHPHQAQCPKPLPKTR